MRLILEAVLWTAAKNGRSRIGVCIDPGMLSPMRTGRWLAHFIHSHGGLLCRDPFALDSSKSWASNIATRLRTS